MNHTSILRKCDVCGQSFNSPISLVRHIKAGHSSYNKQEEKHSNMASKTYKLGHCGVCGQSFNSPTSFARHMRSGHNSCNRQQPECALCGKTFTRRVGIILHLAKVHGEGRCYTCPVCRKWLTSKRYLEHHIAVKHSASGPTCNECGKSFRNIQALISHMQSAHGVYYDKVYRCHLCGMVFRWKDNLERHLADVHSETVTPRFKCEFCCKEYTTSLSLKRHLEKHDLESTSGSPHDLVNQDFGRRKCPETFPSKQELKQPVRISHRKVIEINCKKGSLMMTSQTFESQKTQCTELPPDSEQSLYICAICLKSFRVQQTLKLHIKMCHKESDENNLAPHDPEKDLLTECWGCEKGLADKKLQEIFLASKNADTIIFECDMCSAIYNSAAFAVHSIRTMFRSKDDANELEVLSADQLEATITLNSGTVFDHETNFPDHFSDIETETECEDILTTDICIAEASNLLTPLNSILNDDFSDNFSEIETDSECDEILASDEYVAEARKLLMPVESKHLIDYSDNFSDIETDTECDEILVSDEYVAEARKLLMTADSTVHDDFSDNFSEIETEAECDDILASDEYVVEARKLLMPIE